MLLVTTCDSNGCGFTLLTDPDPKAHRYSLRHKVKFTSDLAHKVVYHSMTDLVTGDNVEILQRKFTPSYISMMISVLDDTVARLTFKNKDKIEIIELVKSELEKEIKKSDAGESAYLDSRQSGSESPN